MQRLFKNRKIEKAHTRREIEHIIRENKQHGWKQISDIKDEYGNFQVLLERTKKLEGDSN